MGLFGLYFAYIKLINGTDHNIFGYKFDERCYYSIEQFAGLEKKKNEPSCDPECPGFDHKNLSCGDYTGFSELITVVYMALSIGGQLTVYVARTKHSFWSRRPGYTLLTASAFAQITTTLLSVYWPLSFKISAYVAQKSIIMYGIGWKMAGFIWIYAVIFFLVEDLVKVYFYYSVDNDEKPDVDIKKIKRKRKPFMPVLSKLSKTQREEIRRSMIISEV